MTVGLAEIVSATGAAVWHLNADGAVCRDDLHVFDLHQSFWSAKVDSRQVTAGDLFVALAGEQTDGHRFLGSALDAGARGCIIADSVDRAQVESLLRHTSDREKVYIFQTPDTLAALLDLAQERRQRHQVEVVGITGSIGKTTGKEIVAELLAAQAPVLRSAGNLNTDVGLALTLLGLEQRHTFAVLEMGMYAAGEIAALAAIGRPRIGIVTNVAAVHLERLGSIEHIARAKSELVAALPSDGLAILNGDDSWTRAMAVSSGIAPAVLVGFAEDCDYRLDSLQTHGLDGISFLLHAEGENIPLRTRVPGSHVAHAFGAAIAAARFLGMSWEAIQAAVSAARLDVRQRLLRPRADLVLIDDSYNAAPQSMQAALELLRASPGEKIAVLGDMLELGAQEESAHRQIGQRAAEIADWLVVRGPRSAWIADEAERRGFSHSRVRRTDTNNEATEAIRSIMSEATPRIAPTMQRPTEDVRWAVLVKGSRGMGMEEVVQGLAAPE